MAGKTARGKSASANRRVHIVLVPGFAGFDALGQLEYYAGVTPQFRGWKDPFVPGRPNVVLHYFDNFPTAAVATRATRLRDYLVKRIARGEFLPGDSLALIGHSTAGLDIRRLIYALDDDLRQNAGTQYPVDGTGGTPFTVSADELLGMVKRIVFLSVPQFGTNIADWVHTYTIGRQVVVAKLRASVEVSQIPLLDSFEECVSNFAAKATDLDLLEAVQDSLAEAESSCSADRMQVALAQEAASELALWLRHMATDFSALDDLTADTHGDTISPAHFDHETRQQEIKVWKSRGIQTKSYASIGLRPFDFDPDQPAPRWDLLNPFSCLDTCCNSPRRSKADIVYRACYRACAGGPFRYPHIDNLPLPPVLVDETGKRRTIAVWDNDGIVNTASMLWPNGRETVLINADHMDMVGHFRRVTTPDSASGRKYQSYDLLQSGSDFHLNKFAQMWERIFDFCVS